MKVTIEIPDPQFKIGDVVRLTRFNDRLGIDLVVQIQGIVMSGRWCKRDDKEPSIDACQLQYATVVQHGIGTEGKVLRPGLSLWPSIAEVDEHAQRVAYGVPEDLKAAREARRTCRCGRKPQIPPVVERTRGVNNADDVKRAR